MTNEKNAPMTAARRAAVLAQIQQSLEDQATRATLAITNTLAAMNFEFERQRAAALAGNFEQLDWQKMTLSNLERTLADAAREAAFAKQGLAHLDEF